MEAKNQNTTLWNRNVNHLDNGLISIGSLIRFLPPLPDVTYVRNDISMLRSQIPIMLFRPPILLVDIAINDQIENSTSVGFVYTRTNLSVNYTALVKTECKGNICDRQTLSDWLSSHRECKCYGITQ